MFLKRESNCTCGLVAIVWVVLDQLGTEVTWKGRGGKKSGCREERGGPRWRGVHAPHSHALLLRKDSSFLASVKSRVSGICQKQILGICWLKLLLPKGVSEQGLANSRLCLQPVFLNKVLLKHTIPIYLNTYDDFQSITAVLTGWHYFLCPMHLKMFTVYPFSEKVCGSLS